MTQDDQNDIHYFVVVNEEEQYSIWPDFKTIPSGWKKDGKWGTKQECLAHINEVWKDMRPLSLRMKVEERRLFMEQWKSQAQKNPYLPPAVSKTVTFLTNDTHPIRVHPEENTLEEFQKALNRGTLHIIFQDTIGKTCLRVDFSRPDSLPSLSQIGRYRLEGSLELDLIPLKCVVEIDLGSMEGIGRLEFIN